MITEEPYDIQQVMDLWEQLSIKVKFELDDRFEKGYLKGTEYTDAFIKLMSQAMQLSFDGPLKQAQVEAEADKAALIDAQVRKVEKEIELAEKEIELKQKQIEQTERQTKGFDDNKEQKMLEAQLNAWAMMFSSGLLEDMPDIINSDEVTKLYCKMADELGIPCSAKEIKKRIESKLKKKTGNQ